MKILIHATALYPMIGGYEAMVEVVAKGLALLGHDVQIITQARPPNENESNDAERFPFALLRNPGFLRWLEALRWADVYLSFNLSVKGVLPWLLRRVPFVISHQGWYSDFNRPKTLLSKVKLFLCRLASNIACSSAVASYLETPSVVIPNTYDDAVFHERPEIRRNRDILFVGRLVSDKGPALVLEAAALLLKQGLRPSITMTGAGPEDEALQTESQKLQLQDQVHFTGPKRGEELGCLMNAHRILVVPSIWAEPFGIVALEGLASGCVVIGSQQGGLKDAIGACGLVFPNGNAAALAKALGQVLLGEWKFPEKRVIDQHLHLHSAIAISGAFAAALDQALRK